MTRDLTEHEIQILREVAGELPPSPWGAWVGACLSALAKGGYITSKFNGFLTEKGRATLDAITDRELDND